MSPAAPIPSPTSTAPQPTCTTAVPDQYGHVPFDSCNSNYSYDPSFTAELAVAVIFGILTLIHLVLAILFKKVASLVFCFLLAMLTPSEILLGPHHGFRMGNSRLRLPHCRFSSSTGTDIRHRRPTVLPPRAALYVDPPPPSARFH